MEGVHNMSSKELNRVHVLEQVLEKTIKNKEGAKQANVSIRHFRRLKTAYKLNGVAGLKHKLRGNQSNRKISQEEINKVINIIKDKYTGFGPTLAHEKLTELGLISFSVEKLRLEMITAGIHSGKHRRKADIHQPRERRYQYGELIQADGSPHDWFEGRGPVCTLLVFIDDATGKLLWLELVITESTNSYFSALNGYLTTHGKPLAIYVDKHSVFRVNNTKKDSASVTDNNGLTQFGRAMKQLDIEVIYANTPQAKGRVERVNLTLQDRLTKELRLENISTIEEANKYLPKFMKKFNAKFGVQPKSSVNAHRPLLQNDALKSILCLRNLRVVSKNLTIQYENKTYLINVQPKTEYTMRKARVEIIEQLNGEISIEYLNKSLDYKTIKTVEAQTECDSKMVNQIVERVKPKQGRNLGFNLFGRTFLLWTKGDISTWG